MALIVGTLGDDNQIIDLFNADDQIYGDVTGILSVAGGDDRIFARGGFDLVSGDAETIAPKGRGGDDLIYGGNDNDDIYGDASENLFGIGGNDVIYQQGGVGQIVGDGDLQATGRGGNDRLYGTGTLIGDTTGDTEGAICGDDLLNATQATEASFLYGDSEDDLDGPSRGGRDKLLGSDYDDTLAGDSGEDIDDNAVGGNDQLYGYAGNDVLCGDVDGSLEEAARGGNDSLRGGAGNDVLYGDGREISGFAQCGDDILRSGSGDDQLWGDGEFLTEPGDDPIGGRDRFHFSGAFGDDTVHDFRQGEDKLVFGGYGALDLSITLDGGDTLLTTLGDDSVRLIGLTDPLTIGVDIIFA